MNRRVLIFESLKERLGEAIHFVDDRGGECVYFRNVSDLPRHLHDPECRVVILPVAAEGLNGILCCRQIKERKAFKAVRVFLIAAGDVGSAESEARAAGCDLFAAGEALRPVIDVLDEVLADDAAPPRRAAMRFDLSGQFFVIRGENAVVAEILNCSRTGILFACTEKIPLETEITLRIQSSFGNELDLPAVVRRTLGLPSRFGEFRHGIGAEFVNLDPAGYQTIDWLLAYREQRLPTWSLKAVEKILSADAPRLAAMLREETSRAFLDVFVKDLPPVERQALESDTYASELMRDLVVSRVHCAAFLLFVPEAARNQAILSEAFAKSLDKLLKRIVELEVRAEKRIQECLSRSLLSEHQDLVGACDRLHAVKMKLLFAIDETLTEADVPETRRNFFRSIREQVEAIRLRERAKEKVD